LKFFTELSNPELAKVSSTEDMEIEVTLKKK
jgi:hypothetical protein